MEFSNNARIITISDEIREKSNGKNFLKCTVEHLDGPLKGKTFFANFTLGEDKETPEIGQEKLVYTTVDPVEKQIYSEISNGASVDNIEDLFDALNSVGVETQENADISQHM